MGKNGVTLLQREGSQHVTVNIGNGAAHQTFVYKPGLVKQQTVWHAPTMQRWQAVYLKGRTAPARASPGRRKSPAVKVWQFERC